MKQSIKSLLLFSFVTIVIVSFFSSCHKTKDTTAKITVKDINNVAVEGAVVNIFVDGTDKPSAISKTAKSNKSGEATFDFNDMYKAGQAGVAVLNVSATLNNKSDSTVIKIEEEKENTATLYIQ